MMFTQEQAKADLTGLTVQEAVIALQVIKRVIKTGALEETELGTVAVLRMKLIEAIRAATGIHYDRAREETENNQQG